MTVFHKLVEGNNYVFSMTGATGQRMSFARINHESNQYLVNARIAIDNGVQASYEFAFDARVVKHCISHGVTNTPSLPSINGEGFSVLFEYWDDYTSFCRFCNIEPQIFNKLTLSQDEESDVFKSIAEARKNRNTAKFNLPIGQRQVFTV